MRNFTIDNIPDEVVKDLAKIFPDENVRAQVINTEVINALIRLVESAKKKKFFDVLDNFQPFPKQDKSSVELIREIRETESKNIFDFE